MRPGVNYEAFFDLRERPFSLTPDPRLFFASPSHRSALAAVRAGLGRGERLLIVGGDAGVGKTMLCAALVEQLRPSARVSYLSNPLLSPAAFEELVSRNVTGPPYDAGHTAVLRQGSGHAPPTTAQRFGRLSGSPSAARIVIRPDIVVIDEAQRMPSALAEHLLIRTTSCATLPSLQIVLVAQSAFHPYLAPLRACASTTVRLLPFTRDECAAYVMRRLALAGAPVEMTSAAIDTLCAHTGGVPRLINVICETALQQAAAAGERSIDAHAVDAAADVHQIVRARPRRFRRAEQARRQGAGDSAQGPADREHEAGSRRQNAEPQRPAETAVERPSRLSA